MSMEQPSRASHKWWAFQDESLSASGRRASRDSRQTVELSDIPSGESSSNAIPSVPQPGYNDEERATLSQSYCMRATMLTLFLIVLTLCFFLISVAVAFWENEETLRSPIVPNPVTDPCASASGEWEHRYCEAHDDLVSFFNLFATSPDISMMCFFPYETPIGIADGDPVTRAGNLVEKGLWDVALRENEWLEGFRTVSADGFHQSLMGAQAIFPFTTNYYLPFPGTTAPLFTFAPPPFRFDTTRGFASQKRLNYISICEYLSTQSWGAGGGSGVLSRPDSVAYENRVIYGKVFTNNENELDFETHDAGEVWSSPSGSVGLGSGEMGYSYFERASFAPSALELLSTDPNPVDYKSAYEGLCEIGVNILLNTAFPTLIGAYSQRAEDADASAAWCSVVRTISEHPSICGYDAYDLMSARWPVVPDLAPGEEGGTTTVQRMVDAINC